MTQDAKPKEFVTLCLLSLGHDGEPRRRMLKYVKQKAQLIAYEENDQPDHPSGLKRIRDGELPKVGGMLGWSVVAETWEQAEKRLAEVLAADFAKASKELNRISGAIDQFAADVQARKAGGL